MSELAGRVAAITGAAAGIGYAVARRLSDEGASVALLDCDGPGARAAASDLHGGVAWECNVGDADQVTDVLAQAREALGPIDILVNNAGIWRHSPVLEVEGEVWDDVFDVNVKGVLRCSQAVAGTMCERRRGKIVNVASVAGFGGSAPWSAYCASKAAALSLTLALADAMRQHNVQVHAVCPGATQTDLLEQIRDAEPESAFDWVHDPQEVAACALDLLVPWDQADTGRIVTMKPVTSALGVQVSGS